MGIHGLRPHHPTPPRRPPRQSRTVDRRLNPVGLSLHQPSAQQHRGYREQHGSDSDYIESGYQVGHTQFSDYESSRARCTAGVRGAAQAIRLHPVRQDGDGEERSAEEVEGRRHHSKGQGQYMHVR